MRRSCNGIDIIGCHNGCFHDDIPIIEDINKAKPDIVFVGMGSPRQEMWIYANRKRIKAELLMGVGGPALLDVAGDTVDCRRTNE